MRAVDVAGWPVVLVFACYNPSPPAGAQCAGNGDCPAPLTCQFGACSPPGTVGSADAGTGGHDAPDAPVTIVDGAPGCTCTNGTLSCPASSATCPLGCVASGSDSARCAEIVPSNGADPTPSQTAGDVVIADTTIVVAQTGEMTGGVDRGAGIGLSDGIDYHTVGSPIGPIGVFSFHSLTITPGTIVHLTGSIPVIFVVAADATIHGTIEGDAFACGGSGEACGGPGGGAGGTVAMPATGCAGAPGIHGTSPEGDTGGGGGGGGESGAAGGSDGGGSAGGLGGLACIPGDLVPLIGGGGGGGGSPGSASAPTIGGGGGGAFQLSAGGTIDVDGVIEMAGGGGGPGPGAASVNAGAGCGGGGGGGILLEAATVQVAGTLAANGGGGGGGGQLTTSGHAGAEGSANASPAPGGVPISGQGSGGAGGAGMAAPVAGSPPGNDPDGGNAGGGGGGRGAIFLRALGAPSVTGVVSPPAGNGPVATQ